MFNGPYFVITHLVKTFTPVVFLFVFFVPNTFSAGSSKVIQPYFNYSFTADDNILRMRDGFVNNPNLLPPSKARDDIANGNLADVSNRFTGGLLLNKEISRQKLTADLNWVYNKFERFSVMNNDFKNATGNWNWVLGKRLEGNMGVTYNESLMPFIFFPGTKVVRAEQTQFINGIFNFHPRWRLHSEYLHYDLDTGKNPRAQNLDRTEDRFEGGIDYVTPSKNTIGVLFRYIIGDFSRAPSIDTKTGRPFSSDYDQKEVMAKINWLVTEKSRLLVTGGWVERKNADFSQRDFSGFNARGTYTWEATDKLGIAISGWRITGAMNNLTANFAVNTGVSVNPHWQATQKIRFEGDFSYETRNFARFGEIFDPGLPIGRKNTLRNASLKAIYMPHPSLQLSASIYHSDLESDAAVRGIPIGGYNANGVTANLQYVYGKR